MSSPLSSWFLLSASSLNLVSLCRWLFVRSGTIVTLSYSVCLSSLDRSKMCLLSSSEFSPMTMGLGSSTLSPTLLQNLICCLLVLTRMPPKIFSHSPLSISILSLGFVVSGPGSGTPCSTRLRRLDFLSLNSSSIILSIRSARSSLSLACSFTSFLVASTRRLSSSMFLLFSSTLESVASCLLLVSSMWVFHLLLKLIQERQAQ